MDEQELVEFLFEQLVEGAVEFTTGIPISPISIFMRFVDWLDGGNPTHRRAAEKAIRRYFDYKNLPEPLFDYGKL